MSDKFYIGQNVRVKDSGAECDGMIGVIVGGNDKSPFVEFYDDFCGHEGTLGNSGLLRKEKNCTSIPVHCLEPLSVQENALYAMGVREGVPFDIKYENGELWEYGPYILENGTIHDKERDEVISEELLCLFMYGPVLAEADEKQQALAKINDLSYELRELADELSNLRSEIEGA